MCVLKKYVEPLLKNIEETDEAYVEAQRLLHMLSFFRTAGNDDVILNNSILREFIGGSVLES